MQADLRHTVRMEEEEEKEEEEVVVVKEAGQMGEVNKGWTEKHTN